VIGCVISEQGLCLYRLATVVPPDEFFIIIDS
jgi:hypothetical protein